MQLTQSTSMRMDQRQLLTPRMIQSMEILQLPLMALEEHIEQELQSNPALEFSEGETEADVIQDAPDAPQERSEGEQSLVVKENSDQAEDFERLAKIGEYFENEEFATNGANFRQAASYDGERDKKLDAMNKPLPAVSPSPITCWGNGHLSSARPASARPVRRSSTTSIPKAISEPTSKRSARIRRFPSRMKSSSRP